MRIRTSALAAALAVSALGLAMPAAASATVPTAQLDTRAAEGRLAQIVAVTGESADLSQCPVGDISSIIAQAPAALGISTAVTQARQSAFTQVGSTSIVCSMANQAGDVVGEVYMGEPYDIDPKPALEQILSADFNVAFDATREIGGGTLITYCARGKTAEITHSFCQADWVSPTIQYGVAAVSPSINGNLVIEWLGDVIEEINDKLAAADVGAVTGGTGVPEPDLDTAGAASAMEDLFGEAIRSGDTGALRDGCPLGDETALVADAPFGLDTSGVRGTLKSRFTKMTTADSILCALFDGQLPSLVWASTEPVADLTENAEALKAGPLTFLPEQEVAGGTLLAYCEENATTKRQNYCQADWQNGDIKYALSRLGENVTAEQIGAWLTNILDEMTTATKESTLIGV